MEKKDKVTFYNAFRHGGKALIFLGTDLFDLLILACLACNVSRALFVNGRAGPGPSERGYVRGRIDANGLNYQSLTRFAINEAVMHECIN